MVTIFICEKDRNAFQLANFLSKNRFTQSQHSQDIYCFNWNKINAKSFGTDGFFFDVFPSEVKDNFKYKSTCNISCNSEKQKKTQRCIIQIVSKNVLT